jgi:predicted dehydrogenase
LRFYVNILSTYFPDLDPPYEVYYRQMLERERPELCIVATHPELHCTMVEECAAAPATRAIICEKPMALSLAECDRMITACERAGVLLQINHNRRWNPHWIQAQRLLAAGAIGELNYIHCYMDGCKPTPAWRSANEGPLLHDFSHYFDLLDLFAEMHAAGKDVRALLPLVYLHLQGCGDCFEEFEALRRIVASTR